MNESLAADLTPPPDLYREFVGGLPESIAQIDQLWVAVQAGAGATETATLHRLVHSLVGAAGTYGCAELAMIGRALEQVLVRAVRGDEWNATQRASVSRLLGALNDVVLELGEHPSVPSMPPSTVVPDLQPQPESENTERRILMIEDDRETSLDLSAQMSFFGYSVIVRQSIEAFEAALLAVRPSGLVINLGLIDAMAPEQRDALAATLQSSNLPLIFFSQAADVRIRLLALRLGGRAYFSIPIDIGRLIDTLDHLTGWRVAPPYRVLVVDDSPMMAAYTASILRRNSVEVATTSDSDSTLMTLESFQPDLVLMDLYLADCTGRELAMVIRQEATGTSLPIVFLSGEMDRATQLEVIRDGGDDFLNKPIQPDHLMAVVRSRIERARTLRAFLVRDSLTGLLNHSAIVAQLESILARAQREQGRCTVAVIDLDHFKQVNDTYGHLVGDRVLRSLARLLQQTLRRSDVIGRYGGEEFIIVFPETDTNGARIALDGVRERWAQVQHQAASAVFTVTLSAGIAEYPIDGAGASLLSVADRALYAAKRSGRNRVMATGEGTRAIPSSMLAAEPETNPPPQAAPTSAAPPEPVMLMQTDGTERQVRVLIVDDDPAMRRLIQHWLSRFGYLVDQATSGEEAIELIERNSSDLVLLDVLLPGLSGLQVLDLLRDSESDMSIVLTTAHGSERLAVDALRRGADDYLRKPLVARELEMTVTRTLARLSLRRQNYVLQQQLNEKRYQLEAELARAAQVQADLLPRTAPDLPGYELAAACLPAREVGGDFYDWHPVIDGKVTITLGDVMGKGMPAALLMATVRAVLRSAVGADQPDLTVNHVAETLGPDLDRAESFVTLFHAQLELATGQIDFVDAGHGCSFVRRFDGSFDADLEPCGAPVGVPYAPPIEMGTIQLDLGDVLVLYSDGLLEVRPELLVHGPSVLAEVLRAATSAQEIVACLAALAAPVVALPDDLTIVVLRRLPL